MDTWIANRESNFSSAQQLYGKAGNVINAF